jgi:hypothetical protein
MGLPLCSRSPGLGTRGGARVGRLATNQDREERVHGWGAGKGAWEGPKRPYFFAADLRENFGQGGLDARDELPCDIALLFCAHDDEGPLGGCLKANGRTRCLFKSLDCDALFAEQDAVVLDIHLVSLHAHRLLALVPCRAEKALRCDSLDAETRTRVKRDPR